MEEKLFWISIACGAYAVALRWFFKKPERVANWKTTAVMHGLFWALAGVVGGSLLSSYWERPDLVMKLMLSLGLGGFLLGALWRAVRNRSTDVSWRFLREDLEWADTGFSAILLAAFIMFFFIQAFKIPSGSMRNTLLEKDHLFVNKFIYGVRLPYTYKKYFRFRHVRHGDIVVFRFPTEDKKSPHFGKDFIKRAIGLPGDVVEIRHKKVFVNGRELDEPYAVFAEDYVIPPMRIFPTPEEFQRHWQRGDLAAASGELARDNFGPVKVPEGNYLCMGDNRDRSFDSRFWGPLPDKYLKGKAWFVYFPFKRMKIIR